MGSANAASSGIRTYVTTVRKLRVTVRSVTVDHVQTVRLKGRLIRRTVRSSHRVVVHSKPRTITETTFTPTIVTVPVTTRKVVTVDGHTRTLVERISCRRWRRARTS